MHSSETMRNIGALEYFLDYCCGRTSPPQRPVEEGRVTGKLVYNLATRTLRVIDLRQKPEQAGNTAQTG